MNIQFHNHFCFRPFVAFLILGLAAMAQAQEATPPRIGLVLGGGGARRRGGPEFDIFSRRSACGHPLWVG